MTGRDELLGGIRALIETVRTANLAEAVASGVDLTVLAAALSAVSEELAPYVVDDVRMQAGLRAQAVHGGIPGQLPDLVGVAPGEFFPYSPVIGDLNPIAPPFVFWVEGDEVLGTGRFGSAYNGPPGGVHGGHVAALLDELLGVTGVMTGNHGFTGTLSIRYEALTPLHTDLDMRAWVVGGEGRKGFIRGEIHAGGTRCATAEGIFIRPALPSTLP